MWSVPAKNMKKINMSISFVYDVSIQDNCENAVFTFLPFYKQNIAFFLFLTYHCCVVDFGYSEGESLSYCTCRITFSTIKEYSMGTTQPIRNKDELTAFRVYYKDIRQNSAGWEGWDLSEAWIIVPSILPARIFWEPHRKSGNWQASRPVQQARQMQYRNAARRLRQPRDGLPGLPYLQRETDAWCQVHEAHHRWPSLYP